MTPLMRGSHLQNIWIMPVIIQVPFSITALKLFYFYINVTVPFKVI